MLRESRAQISYQVTCFDDQKCSSLIPACNLQHLQLLFPPSMIQSQEFVFIQFHSLQHCESYPCQVVIRDAATGATLRPQTQWMATVCPMQAGCCMMSHVPPQVHGSMMETLYF